MNSQSPASDPDTDAYNYASFVGDDDFLAFRTALPVGSPAPDAEAIDLASGGPVRLSAFWRERDLLVEFGSLT